MAEFSLKDHDLHVAEVYRNPAPALLYEHAIRFETKEKIADRGALVAYSGGKTGRSPRDKRVVKDPKSEKDVWWGAANLPLERHSFEINRERARGHKRRRNNDNGNTITVLRRR